VTPKKREFGLAAQLTQPRGGPIVPGPALEPVMEPAAAPLIPIEPDAGPLDAHALPLRTLSHSDHTDRIERSRKQKKPGAPQRPGGYVRRTITLGPALSDYVDRSWRTYRTIDGKYVKGVSGFIEAIIDEHRRRGQ
jgi:hypothetical protein